jgi:N-acetylglucosamine kinase-like BadF-type ATPase
VIVKAAGQGDACAAAILADAARELAEMVDVTRRRLQFPPAATVPVSYSGGVFTAAPVLATFGQRLTALDSAYELRRPLYAPVIGAAIYAAKLAGTPLGDSALDRLASSSSATSLQRGAQR